MKTAIAQSFRVLILLIPLLFAYTISQAEEGKRPKIGYVLSGGGAKGMAHVGVLKVLEEVGLQPDYITGTSMGSIMGGLYSIGFTADDLTELIETVDWSKVLTNEIPSNKVSIRRKHEYSRHILEIPIYNGKPELPAGLIEGQKLSALFSELTWSQAGVDDFNDFPYPYSCIAADILTGKKVELNSGDLSSAMRSSMAIPSVFTAVQRDDHLLVDGGVVRNFPVQEAIDMGADIIIGVYVGFDPDMSADQLRSLTAVITRASLLSGALDVDSQMPMVDYLILPDLKGFTPADFTSGVEIMQRGEEAARSQIDQLKALADSINALGQHAPVHHLPSNDSLLITDIRVLDASEKMAEFFVAKSGLETGTYLHPDQLNEGIDQLFGTLFFTKIEYYFEKNDPGYRLVFRIKEKAQSAFHAGVHYDNTFGPGLLLNFTHLNSLVEGSRASVTVDFSGAPQFNAYYDVHLGKKRDFIATVFGQGEREKLPYYEDGVDIGDVRYSIVEVGLGLRQILATNNSLGADIYYRASTLALTRNFREANPEYSLIEKIMYRGPEFRIVYGFNNLDNVLYPTRGHRAHLGYRQAFASKEILDLDFGDSIDIDDRFESDTLMHYWHLRAAYDTYIPLAQKFSLNLSLNAGISKDEKPIIDNYYIGGYGYTQRTHQVPFMGLHSHELLHGNYLGARLGIQWEVIPNLWLRGLGNIIAVSDELSELLPGIPEWTDKSHYMGAGGGFTYKTPIGPISVYLGSRTSDWRPIWYTNIGFTL